MKRFIIIIAVTSLLGAVRKPINLAIAKNDVERYYESCEYAKEVKIVVQQALKYFKTHHFERGAVVIFDIDDTLLSDYCEMKQLSFGFVPKLNHEWILKAVADEVPHIKVLYDYCITAGYDIVLISGRNETEREATIKNLTNHGFTGFKQLILRNSAEKNLTALAYKSAHRKELVASGAHIVGCIGDQLSDLRGGNTGYQVKIPNYMYIIE